ncbi:MAG: Lrp/AsnC family transcriptional regulator [Thermococcus sp.]|uniref:Transcriptional regulator n=1 Tax=Thermococcus guaymasensis DSM 11113 TaxID=1432656 RepID=A0A0X1KJW9_9EURY|nr:Lrp/AsnC family transcriptional regulator [Thermococcus guaymasensis]AJC71563.1 transcriptional regulator [Thermococcus guaymasensis DSM 11113]MCD6525277.1 Lrp/AsnC family transcriptional regulator [Thermococcus sp.]
MQDVNPEEIQFLVEILNKHPTESLKRIAELESLDYYKLTRVYNRYYGKYVFVNALYDIKKLGLKSYIAFVSVPKERLREVAARMRENPFILDVTAMFGFKNGISAILHVPKDQVDLLDEVMKNYSDDYEYYEVRAYPPSNDDDFGGWNLSYQYAVLMDILKWDARTPLSEIARELGKSRPTVRFMIKTLMQKGILIGYIATVENTEHDRGVLGIASELREDVLSRFAEYEINVGVLLGVGYLLEWYFSSKEDLAQKLFEFSGYVEKLAIEYFDMLADVRDMYPRQRFSRMVRRDGKGYRSILEF